MKSSLISPVVLPFSMAFLFGMLLVGVPLKAIALGATSLELGYIGFIGAFFFVSLVAPAGRLVGRISALPSITSGCLLFALCSFGIALSKNLTGIYLMVAGYSIGLAFYWPALESKLGDTLHPGQLVRRTGFFNVSVSLGFTAGFLLAGILFDLKPELPFFLASALVLALPFILILDKPAEEPEKQDSTLDEIIPPGAIRYLYLAWMSNAASHFALINLSNIFPKLARELGMSGTDIGILLFSLRLSMSIIFFALIFSTRWHFSLRFLVAFQLIQILGLSMVAFAENMALFAAAFMLVGAGASVTYFSSLYYGLVLARKNGSHDPAIAGKHSGLHEFYLGLGILTGPLLGGVVARFVSLRSPYWLALGVIAVMLSVELIYAQRSKPAQDQNPGNSSTS
jgi:MFS family permease